jgi:ribA/ribD-fused uncharacterized protein
MSNELEYNGCRGAIPTEHYSDVESECLFFYGGWGSNFVGPSFELMLTHFDAPWLRNGRLMARYHTVEHYFQACKAITKADHLSVASHIHPGAAKQAGRKIALREDWEDVKYAIMCRGVRAKFNDSQLQRLLLATGDRYIAEDSPTDEIWGIRTSEPRLGGSGNLGGLNLLGKALMDIRSEIGVLR